MKVTAPSDAFNILNAVKESRDETSRHPHHQKKQNDKDHPDSEDSPVEVTAENVNEAIQSFQADAMAQSNGLTASAIGHGPGLKVILKDGTGGIVRQFTGEEFLELRKAVSKEGRARGKILDQKL